MSICKGSHRECCHRGELSLSHVHLESKLKADPNTESLHLLKDVVFMLHGLGVKTGVTQKFSASIPDVDFTHSQFLMFRLGDKTDCLAGGSGAVGADG